MDESDEISLVDLWHVIAKRKAIILLSLLLSMLLAFVYLFFAEPVYKANAYLVPPQHQKIQGLLVGYLDIEGIDANRYAPESVYRVFLDNLKSQRLRREFFDNHELIKHYTSGESAKDVNADRVFDGLFNERLLRLTAPCQHEKCLRIALTQVIVNAPWSLSEDVELFPARFFLGLFPFQYRWREPKQP
ncbi:hypothetical protein MNBD_GAMMA13-2121 [hydrothermal vent metagenome]|uniref:Polysaccharide chain length determinant N-terminal domain-containing protein n=1 Tax=hydrothermal vent metagenome TaxID=652676 RepID=A0A3B0ZBL9_9ZZZZ